MAQGKLSKNIPKRASNPARAARRARSLKRCEVRKAERTKLHEEGRVRNRALRREGLPTPAETRTELRRAARAALFEAGKLIPKPRNERGFIIEPDGTLRDPGNWNRRRKQRYEDIQNGLITVLGNPGKNVSYPEKGFKGGKRR